MWRVVSVGWQKSARLHRPMPSASPTRDVELQHEGSSDSSDNNGKDREQRRNKGGAHRTTSRSTARNRHTTFWDQAWLGVLAGAALFVILLVLVEVMKNRRIRAEIEWDKYYMRAVVSDSYRWQTGWRLEDLAKQTTNQRNRMNALQEALAQVPPSSAGRPPLAAKLAEWMGGAGKGEGFSDQDAGSRQSEGKGGGEKKEDVTPAVLAARVLVAEEDLNRIVSVECGTRPEKYVQVGMHPMEASAETSCKVFSAAVELDPNALFEKFELGEGSFALRAFSNGRFLRVVPPPLEAFSEWHVWKLEVGAPEVGLPEVFQMRDGMVYSEVMHGYLSCSGAGREAELKGFVGEYLWYSQENYQLVFNRVSDEAIERARILRDISRAVNSEQRRQVEGYLERKKSGQHGRERSRGRADEEPEIIAICVPMTSRGTDMNSTRYSPVWDHAFETFLSTTEWDPPRFRYFWYFGFDAGDPIYDSDSSKRSLHNVFQNLAKKEFRSRGFDAEALVNGFLRLETKYYKGFENAPSHVVSALIRDAYDDGCDYFYQINDDTVMNSLGWAETFTAILRTNPLGRNVGVTGPSDTNNRRILTHAFVHRTHIDIFGRYFPVSFRNWWSDDWISNVYGNDHTLRDHMMTITHDVNSQKLQAHNRYDIDFSAEDQLGRELQEGHVKLSRWLKGRGFPPPMLPMVCGYAPLANNILGVLKISWDDEQTVLKAERAKKESEASGMRPGAGKRDRSRDRDMGDGAPVDLDSPERHPKRIMPEVRVPPEPPAPPEVIERAASIADGENILDKEGEETEEVAKKEKKRREEDRGGTSSSTVVIMPRKVDGGKWRDREEGIQEEEGPGESGVGGGEAGSDEKGGNDEGLGQVVNPNPNRVVARGNSGFREEEGGGAGEGGGIETVVDEPWR